MAFSKFPQPPQKFDEFETFRIKVTRIPKYHLFYIFKGKLDVVRQSLLINMINYVFFMRIYFSNVMTFSTLEFLLSVNIQILKSKYLMRGTCSDSDLFSLAHSILDS